MNHDSPTFVDVNKLGQFVDCPSRQQISETNSMPCGDGGKGEELRHQSQEGQELSASAGPRQFPQLDRSLKAKTDELLFIMNR